MKNLLLVLTLLFTTNLYAQELNPKQKERIGKDVAEMTKVMELSPKQEKKCPK